MPMACLNAKMADHDQVEIIDYLGLHMTRRQEKVASLMMREMANLITRKIKDPRVRGVHLVSVDMSPDLHLARIFFSILGDETTPEKAQEGLDSAKGFIRRELKKHVQLRTVPELAFWYDPSIEQGDNILTLLGKLRKDG